MPAYDAALETYVRTLFAEEDESFVSIRERTVAAGLPEIMIRPEEGRFLEFLSAVVGAKKALEIGTLGGYSSSWIVRGMPDDGRLITIESNPEHARVASENFHHIGLADRVDVRIGDAHQILDEMSAEAPFDLIFIDAEKEGYADYYSWAVENLATGGILAAHNALSHGAVADPEDQRERTRAIRAFNKQISADPDFVSLIFPAGDGIVFGFKNK